MATQDDTITGEITQGDFYTEVTCTRIDPSSPDYTDLGEMSPVECRTDNSRAATARITANITIGTIIDMLLLQRLHSATISQLLRSMDAIYADSNNPDAKKLIKELTCVLTDGRHSGIVHYATDEMIAKLRQLLRDIAREIPEMLDLYNAIIARLCVNGGGRQ